MSKQIADKQFEEEVLSVDRVTRVVAGGRRLRFRAIVVVGDRNGRIALGTGKANEVNSAVQKATRSAKKNMIRVPIFNGTIPHETEVRYKSAHVALFPARAGTGIIAGSVIRKILSLAGYRNILSKMHGSSNKLLNAQALISTLRRLKVRKSRQTTGEGEGHMEERVDKEQPKGRGSISSRPEAKKERGEGERGDGRGGRGGRGRGPRRGGSRQDNRSSRQGDRPRESADAQPVPSGESGALSPAAPPAEEKRE